MVIGVNLRETQKINQARRNTPQQNCKQKRIIEVCCSRENLLPGIKKENTRHCIFLAKGAREAFFLFQAALFLFLPEGFPFRFGNLLITHAYLRIKKIFFAKQQKFAD